MNQLPPSDAPVPRGMTAASRWRFAARRPLVAIGLFLALFAGCGELLVEPALMPASIRLAIGPAPGEIAADGIGDAFDRADQVRVRILREGVQAVEVVRDFLPSDMTTVSVTVSMEEDQEVAVLIVELLGGGAVLFRSESSVVLVSGGTPTVEMPLSAVPGRIEIAGEPRLTFTAVPDTVRLSAAVLFATGDTIPRAPIAWVSTDPRVATVHATSGQLLVLAEGTARIRATHGDLGDEVEITVRRTVRTVAVSPAERSIAVGDTLQLTAIARDARQNPITGRPVTWSSSNPAIEVDASGRVVAVAAGTATVSATIDDVTGSARIVASPGLPPTGPFHGDWYGYSEWVGEFFPVDLLHLNLAQETGKPFTGVLEGFWWGSAPATYNDIVNVTVSDSTLSFVLAPPFEGETGGAEFELTLNPDGTLTGLMAKCWSTCDDYYTVYFDRDPASMPPPSQYSYGAAPAAIPGERSAP